MLTAKAFEVLVAKNLQQVRSPIRDLAAVADELRSQGKTVLMLNIGDPLDADFSTPPELVEAVVRALRDGKNGYAPALGVGEALDAIRADAERKGVVNIQDVFVTEGVSEAVDICLTALLNPGDDLLVPRPGYPLYSAVLAKIGAGRNPYDLAEELDWEPDVESLAAHLTPSTRGIVLINPNNPTGAVHSRRTLEAVAELARQNNLIIFADEIYDRVIFDGAEHVPMASLAPDVPIVTFGGLSKGFLATGWRVGWCVVSGPRTALCSYPEGMHKLLRARLSANHPVQYAIRPALEGMQQHLPEMIAKLQARRDLTLQWCESTPRVRCIAPKGGFYAFPRLDIPEDDLDFVKALLLEKQVLVVHGGGFGEQPGTRHIRIVFLPQETALCKGYQAIGEFMAERYGT
ncbi:MAG TPA: aminotransferase class I/II-fold pyridoxal phosphate-dependent enzyme [Terriglobales bacterium]|nr:aminotransferase class I/II-fold pyridoxal phosphate-dependent enzyme [Terriglobales bacterium]